MIVVCWNRGFGYFHPPAGLITKVSKEGREDWRLGYVGDTRLARKCLLVEGGGEGARGDFVVKKEVQS